MSETDGCSREGTERHAKIINRYKKLHRIPYLVHAERVHTRLYVWGVRPYVLKKRGGRGSAPRVPIN